MEAIGQALDAVSGRDVLGWFAHCVVTDWPINLREKCSKGSLLRIGWPSCSLRWAYGGSQIMSYL